MKPPQTPEDPALGRILEILVQTFHPVQVFLFGSRVRGESTRESDYDLLLVVADDSGPEARDPRRAYEALWGLGIAVDVVIWTRSGFESRLPLKASLPATVLREGRLLYAA
ncbi:MAG: nucleotidyltransferase domain-containing protein [Planctomycetota bacterium]